MSGALVMTPIIPAKFNEAAFWEEIAGEAQKLAKEIKKDFEGTTKTWKTKVVFEELYEIGPNDVTIFVGTDNEIYGFVDKGKRPHRIEPKGNYPLAFRSGYTGPKTKPGSLRSVNRGKATAPIFLQRVSIIQGQRHVGFLTRSRRNGARFCPNGCRKHWAGRQRHLDMECDGRVRRMWWRKVWWSQYGNGRGRVGDLARC